MLHPTCISNCLRLKRERHVAITMVYSHKSRPEPLGLDPSPQPIRNDPSDTMRFEWFGLFRFGSAGARGTINQTLDDRHINCSTNQPTASFIHNSFALPHVGSERSTIDHTTSGILYRRAIPAIAKGPCHSCFVSGFKVNAATPAGFIRLSRFRSHWSKSECAHHGTCGVHVHLIAI